MNTLGNLFGKEKSCRVLTPTISVPGDDPKSGNECVIETDRVGDVGSRRQETSAGVIYYRPGMVIREFNHRNLRVPQMRDWLGPQYFYSGCVTRYGNSSVQKGCGQPSEAITEETQNMYDHLFTSQDYGIATKSCTECAGVKNGTLNSYTGY